MNFNLVHSVEDISEDSGPAAEPVTLQEVKDYLRLEGIGLASSGITMQEPISGTLISGKVFFDAFLQQENVVITTLQREGLGYTQTTGTPGSRQFVFDNDAGTITFLDDGSNVTIDISYGISGESNDLAEFDYDDTLIETIIVAARQWCEARTGCSLVTKRIQAYATNLSGRLSLPAGPITGAVTGLNSDGDAIDSACIKLVGTKFPELTAPKLADMTLTYDAGYTPTTIPKGLKMAILAYSAAVYESRGDEDQADLKQARQLCAPYIKYSAWA